MGTLSTVLYGVSIGQGFVQQSRFGIVSYASKARVVAPLTQFRSFDELMAGLGSIVTADASAEVNLRRFVG